MKFENFCNGSNCKFEFKLTLPDNDQDNNSNTGMPQARAHSSSRFGRQLAPGGYEPGSIYRKEKNTMNDDDNDSDSSSDSGLDSLSVNNYSVTKRELKPGRLEPFNGIPPVKSGKREYTRERMHLQVKKHDGLRKVLQSEVTTFFKKHKNAKTIPKQLIKNHYIVYPLGSDFEGMRFETHDQISNLRYRLGTFDNYRGNGDRNVLARNGFYHDHNHGPSSTRCFACNAKHSAWTLDDDVSTEHRRLSPQCPFLTATEQNDVAQTTSSFTTSGQLNRTSSTTSAVNESQRYINVANSKLTMEHGNQERSTCGDDQQMREQSSARSSHSSFTQRKQDFEPDYAQT